jgi:hypothetical protein
MTTIKALWCWYWLEILVFFFLIFCKILWSKVLVTAESFQHLIILAFKKMDVLES